MIPPTRMFPAIAALPPPAVRCVTFTLTGLHPVLLMSTTISDLRFIFSAQGVVRQLMPLLVCTWAPAGFVSISRTSSEPLVTVAHPEKTAIRQATKAGAKVGVGTTDRGHMATEKA
ncbi:hypothetical protein APX01_21645 (plasmid) [Cereibacter sphaeroides]|nr:hypothetical protein APX01_21645 [Cereibacter sphaeroides]ANS36695.1 hypothetical protein A3858_20740 [Cereibacter sphaeroides]ATN65883.1 hypothetical protein A3857_21420 [Cereibacter sphaeroides]